MRSFCKPDRPGHSGISLYVWSYPECKLTAQEELLEAAEGRETESGTRSGMYVQLDAKARLGALLGMQGVYSM